MSPTVVVNQVFTSQITISTVSPKPPCPGTVPYCTAPIWLSPQGSTRSGINKIWHPEYVRGGLDSIVANPTNFALYLAWKKSSVYLDESCHSTHGILRSRENSKVHLCRQNYSKTRKGWHHQAKHLAAFSPTSSPNKNEQWFVGIEIKLIT